MADFTLALTGRGGTTIPDHFQERIEEKLPRALKMSPHDLHVEVELQKESNPRRDDNSCKLQITATGHGKVLRSEAKEDSFYAALEVALDKLERTFRKDKVRREVTKSGHRAPLSTAEVMNILAGDSFADKEDYAEVEYDVEEYLPGQIVRTKTHEADPMTPDEALGEMELVGHDFYLFINSETDRPTVVYRRHGFDYGLIDLQQK